MIILENIIINYKDLQTGNTAKILQTVHITNGVIKYIDPKEQLKNLEETIDGSPKELYEQTHFGH
ncbi:hypothetical protein EXVC031PHodr_026 [Pelagibacter phage EXVC032P Baldr]|nr:hypothetical protein EXVC031PHodr_026 [Pelagibacter phage EXVC032P Baldr]